jgi:translocation and assembly module TamB
MPALRLSTVRIVGVLALLVVATLIAVAVWLSGESGLRWALERLAMASRGAVIAEGVSGSALRSIRIARVTYREGTTLVEARDLGVTLGWRGFASGRLVIKTLDAALISVTSSGPSAAPGLPQSLALPIEVDIAQARAERLEIIDGASRIILSALRFAYSGGGARHMLRDLAVSSPVGNFTGALHLGAARPFPLAGEIRAAAATPVGSATVVASLSGVLDRIDAVVKVEVADTVFSARAVATPFSPLWLPSLTLDGQGVNIARARAGLPASDMVVAVKAGARAEGGIAGEILVRNGSAGPIDKSLLPLTSLAMNFALVGAVIDLSEIHARFGAGNAGGEMRGRAQVNAAGVNLDLALTGMNLALLDSRARATRLAGSVRGTATPQRQSFDLDLRESGMRIGGRVVQMAQVVTVPAFTLSRGRTALSGNAELNLEGGRPFAVRGRFRNLDPAEFGDFPRALLSGEATAQGRLVPAWQVDVRANASGIWRDAPLVAEVTGRIMADRVQDARVRLRVGVNTLSAEGSFGARGDASKFSIDAPRLAQLDAALSGALSATGAISGPPTLPRVVATGNARAVRMKDRFDVGTASFNIDAAPAPDQPLKLRLEAGGVVVAGMRLASIHAMVAGSAARHSADITVRGDDVSLTSRLSGTWVAPGPAEAGGLGRWDGRIEALQNTGAVPLRLAAPVALVLARGLAKLDAARIDLARGRLLIREARWENARLATAGEFSGLPLAPLVKMLRQDQVVASDMLVGGRWQVSADPEPRGEIVIAREAGDIAVLQPARLPLGLDRVEARIVIAARSVAATLEAASPTMGTVSASGELEAAGRTPLEALAALSAESRHSVRLKARLKSLRAINPLLGNVALVDGAMSLDLRRDGTLKAPMLAGTLEGDRIKIEAPQYGIELRDGRLRAHFSERELVVDELVIAAREGRFTAQGTVRTGEAGKSLLSWRAEKLLLLNRPDMRVVLDGDGTVSREAGRILLTGQVRAEEGLIDFGIPSAPELGDDVVILGRGARAGPEKRRSTLLGVDLRLDFGRRFQVRGRGIETRLGGQLHVTSASDGALMGKGEVQAQPGSYTAFGQQLTIDRGRLIFDGPLDNPALDIRALRKNLAVEAGIELTGTMTTPRVRLVSEPAVDDGEKISWLTLGRGLDSATKADAGLLQAAASALLTTGGSVPVTRRIASAFGLDSVGVRGSTAQDQVISLGKRVSNRLYLSYEQGFGIASSVIRIDYTLRRGLALRAEAGTTAGFGIFFNRAFE